MRRKRDYTDYLRDILNAAQKAERFIAGVEFEAFQSNSTLRDMLLQKSLTTGIPLSPIYSHARASVSLALAHLPERQKPCPKSFSISLMNCSWRCASSQKRYCTKYVS